MLAAPLENGRGGHAAEREPLEAVLAQKNRSLVEQHHRGRGDRAHATRQHVHEYLGTVMDRRDVANVARLNVNRGCMQERDDQAMGRSTATTTSRPHDRALTERGNQSMP